jgi:hypothetical protein
VAAEPLTCQSRTIRPESAGQVRTLSWLRKHTRASRLLRSSRGASVVVQMCVGALLSELTPAARLS